MLEENRLEIKLVAATTLRVQLIITFALYGATQLQS